MEKRIRINGLEISYWLEGAGKDILLLHGWGVSKESMAPVFNNLSKDYRVCAPDLPGFGASQEPETPWSVADYAAFAETFIAAVELDHPLIIGHSNGGRIAIRLVGGGYRNICKLVLTGSTGIIPKRKIGYYIRLFFFKSGKRILKLPAVGKLFGKVFDPSKYGSADYKAASPIMKQTMVKLLHEDLKSYMPSIACPVLLVWGDKDTAVPLEDGKTMEKLIPDAGLVVYKNAGHYAFLENFNSFIAAVRYFIEH